jgi:hypothetical protein
MPHSHNNKANYGLRDIPRANHSSNGFAWKADRRHHPASEVTYDLVKELLHRFREKGCHFQVNKMKNMDDKLIVITPEVRVHVCGCEDHMKQCENKLYDKLTASFRCPTRLENDITPYILQEFPGMLGRLQKKFPSDTFIGRPPTLSMIDPAGGFWSTTRYPLVERMQPIFCKRLRLDLDEPILIYQPNRVTHAQARPSSDAAQHGFFLAALIERLGVRHIVSFPGYVENPNLVYDHAFLNDCRVAQVVASDIVEQGHWTDETTEFFVQIGTNTIGFFTDIRPLKLFFEKKECHPLGLEQLVTYHDEH